jgi:uncharacterized protein (DUF4415 family)
MRAKSNSTRRYSSKPDDDLPEITAEMLRRGHFEVAGKRVTHAVGAAAFRKAMGRPKLENPKQLLTLRLPPEVIERWRKTGPGWQTRMAERLSRVA